MEYAESAVVESRTDKVARLEIEVSAGFKSKRAAIKELNPNMDDGEIDALMLEIEEEAPVVDRALLTRRSAAYRLGGMVLIGLAILTAIEYGFGLALPSIVALLIIGLFKAGLIMQYFMHVSTLWSEEGH